MQYQPTVPMPPPQGQRPPQQRRNGALIVGLIAALLVGAGIGFVVSMSNDEEPEQTTAVAAPAGNGPVAQLGTLEVVSVPGDGTVTVDGRLVGLTPIDRLDLDPGRHAVVIEVHGYEPYVGTITIEAGGASALEAHLAEAGGGTRSTGTFTGAGKAVDRVPTTTTTTAAAPPDPDGDEPDRKSRRRRSRDRGSEPVYSPPPRVREPPRRDCSAEESACASKCDDAHFSCWSSCKYCGSCVSSMTWDECNRICNTCKQGCEQNKDFCEASCEGIGDACRASQ